MKRNRSERGQSLVEFGISLVVILFLLAGAVEFGLALFQYIQLRDAAQEGAVYGSICPIPAKIEARVRNHSSSPVDLSVTSGTDAVSVVVQGRDGTTATLKDINLVKIGDGVYVEVSYNHRLFMPFATLFTGGSDAITIRASVTNTVLDNNTTKASCK
jgi:Flp pilus assembly protein TadG